VILDVFQFEDDKPLGQQVNFQILVEQEVVLSALIEGLHRQQKLLHIEVFALVAFSD